MELGMTWDKILLIGLIAVLILGPERLPTYAEKLGRFVRNARDYLRNAQERVKTEMGEDFDDVDWRKLDPRQYAPRRIVREALLDDAPPARVGAAAGGKPQSPSGPQEYTPPPPPPRRSVFSFEEPPPHDDEAT
ncbi:twin-arginine translocase TatA/TatE family subunit [Microbacterium sp. JB110]|uniref:twin-arginine translocase TatA/TatE family subunit n=1 Tax=Microbacterium sp. JB110 TaxID=2024477 RepID=UPI000DF29148|nr:twin-arginine translocase TatA/TatE family subunit [Microbacterium sp. JB110]RCS61998.1 Sec-independent protein translocase TatB [Microbacterium sp. JB110]